MLQENIQLNENRTPGEPPQPLYHGARGAAVKILTRIDQSDAYLDKLLMRELSGGELNDPDKRLLNELATGVLRWQAKLDWILTGFYHGEFLKCIPIVKNALRVALYQILFLDRIPPSAAVNESVEFIKRLKGERSANLVNAVLRSIIRKVDSITYPDPTTDYARYLGIVFSHPHWMVRRWIGQIGVEQTEALLRANNERPDLTIRVNPLRTTPEELSAELGALGVKVSRSQWHPGILHIEGLPNIAGNRGFAEGRFSIQDEGSALAARLTDARPGMRIIDLCAAPGGKSIAMAEMMGNSGEIVAVDKYEGKLRLIEELARRTGYDQIVSMVTGDARNISLEPADIVLVDAPCSGLGVLSKKPDIKWKRRAEDIDSMAALQLTILEHAATLVKPGGHLVYSTCTIEPAENQDTVKRFLASHPDFVLVPARQILPEQVVTPDGFLLTYPHIHGVDGTFGARLQRKG